MAQLVEKILVWVAVLVTLAALVVVGLNYLPGIMGDVSWMHRGAAKTPAASTMDLAEQAMTQGKQQVALSLAQRAVEENPADAAIANRAGNVALEANDQQTAERYYRAGEDADAHYPWNFVALGQLYERQGKKQLADAQLRVATAAAPDQPFIHYDLGVVELEEGLYAAALSDFEIELKRSPTYRPAMVGRAEALDKLGRKGEAVALLQKAGVDTRSKAASHPKLAVKHLAAPSPTPAPTPTLTPTPTPTPTPTATAVAAIASPKPTAHPAPARRTRPLVARAAAPTPPPRIANARPPWAGASVKPGGTVASAPTATPIPIEAVSGDARSYLLDVTQDLGFTRSLPSGDPNEATSTLRSRLNFALASRPPNVESMLEVGAAALLSGRMALAASAFNAAAQAAPHDWRGPYYEGLTAQATGDLQQASTEFGTALAREPRAEAYTSLAVIDLQNGDISSAAVNAEKATQTNPAYEPGRFVAGMIDLIQADVRGAQSNLAAAQALGGAPSRTAYFLAAISSKT